MAADERLATLQEGRKLRIVGKTLKRPAALLKQIGAIMTARSQKAFQDQKRGDNRWQFRAVPNIPGIIQDLSTGGAVKARRFDKQPAGVDTGRLRNSISFALTTPDTVEIGTNVPYAGLIQFGGDTEVEITPLAKDGLKEFLQEKGPTFEHRDRLLPLLEKETFETSVPARPFILLTDEDRRDIKKLIGVHVREA